MPKLVVTPWKWHEELLEVRAWFYPNHSHEGPDLRRQACALTTVWKRRGRLPHAIESTALITDAILHDEGLSENDVSELSLRGTYAMALNKFVTRLADKYQNKTKRRSSMYNSARALNLPDAFVEIRHQITHGDLPSLVVLRNYAKRALSWLWQHYWSTINVHKTGVLLPSPVFIEGEEAVEKGLREALREYRDLSVQAIKKDPKKFRELRDNLPTETSLEVFRMCRGDLEAIRALCKVFLERKMLIPSSTTLESNVQGAFDIWDALLKNLSLHNRDFLPLLVHEMFSVLGAPSMLDVRHDEVREALYEWMMHFLTSEEWRHPRSRHAIIGSTLNACIMTQNYWTRKLLINVAIKSKDAAIKVQYGRLAKQAIESCTGARAAPEGELPDDSSSEEEDEEEGSDNEKVYDPADDILGEDLECLASQGWKLADNWAPTPFGTQPAFPLFSI